MIRRHDMDGIAAIRTLRARPYGLAYEDARFLVDYARSAPGEVAVWDVPDSARPLDRILVRWHAGEATFKVPRCAGAGTPILGQSPASRTITRDRRHDHGIPRTLLSH